jgi:hypothetical protein
MLSRYKGDRYRAAANPELVAFVESDELHSLDYDSACDFYAMVAETATEADLAYLGCVDRYFLFTAILGRHDGFHPWLYDRCREVELEPDGFLDLWSRDHRKSSLITFSGCIQEILSDPDITIGIFSHTQKIAKEFVKWIRREFEANSKLRRLYPDVCWLKPASEAPVWTENAFTVRRRGNSKEATLEGWGLVDGQPTGKHFRLIVYDDVVTKDNVANADQIKKTTESWELSDNLGADDARKWHIGTRYSFADSYSEIINKGVVTVRKYPATDNGRIDGKPVFLDPEVWEKKKKAQTSTLAAQMLQNPLSGKERTFDPTWFKRWEVRPAAVNVYIMADPSRGRTATSDRTAMPVIAIDTKGKKYLVDGFCHRMTLSQRWDNLKHLHKKWAGMPGVGILKVGYERFGQQSDDEYFTERMRNDNYFFNIEELAWPREGGASKEHRVERLQPDVQFGTFYFPAFVHVQGQGDCQWSVDEDQQIMRYEPLRGETAIVRRMKERGQGYLAAAPIKRKNEAGEIYDLTRELIDEMMFFPFAQHDDLVDAVSRIYDMEPMAAAVIEVLPEEKIPEDA